MGEGATGYLYAIRCSEFVKFGYSRDPEKRLREIQVHCPFLCEIEGLELCEPAREFEVHAMLSRYRHRGEWFLYTADVREFAQSMPLKFIHARTYLNGRRQHGAEARIEARA